MAVWIWKSFSAQIPQQKVGLSKTVPNSLLNSQFVSNVQSALHSYKNGNNGKIGFDTIDRRWDPPGVPRNVNELVNQPVQLLPARQSLAQGRARSVSSSAPTAPLITFRQISSSLIPASGTIPARPCPCKEETNCEPAGAAEQRGG